MNIKQIKFTKCRDQDCLESRKYKRVNPWN